MAGDLRLAGGDGVPARHRAGAGAVVACRAGRGLRVAQDPGGWGGITLAHNIGSPDEVDAVLAEAQDAGGTVVRAAIATDWGGYSGVPSLTATGERSPTTRSGR